MMKDKVVVVTGSSSGIGAAIALRFAKEGAKVVVNYRDDERGGVATLEKVREVSPSSILIQADVSTADGTRKLYGEVKSKFSHVDILINNTGIFREDDNPDNLDVIEELFQTNFFTQIQVTNIMRKLMNQGKIIFISSVHGKIGNGRPEVIGYSASKAALDSYMKNLAKALAPNILVNSIQPGRTLTPMWNGTTDEESKQLMSEVLTGRWVKPEEIADGAVFLAQNDSMCGETLTIDGGMSLETLG